MAIGIHSDTLTLWLMVCLSMCNLLVDTRHSRVLTFPHLIKNSTKSDKCENVSYDVESLFTSVAVEEAINYITNQIYVQKEIEPFSKKIF